jgi:hypothetical protein
VDFALETTDPIRGFLVGAGRALGLVVVAACSEVSPPPPQPIAFNHRAHAENEIECTRCHQGVESQAKAGLPPISACAVCHRRRDIPDHPEVLKFMGALEAGDTIRWRKVNVMPEGSMVHFKHNPHIRAGVDCATCHGDVAQMALAQEVIETADMGWCVGCHRDNGASVDCLTCHH